MEFIAEVSLLSPKFIKAYPASMYPELMWKQGRPYACLLIDTHDEYLICIPFRSHISHNNAYIFHNTQRSKNSRSGLDYSKIALVKDPSYIDTSSAIVDKDEYAEAIKNLPKIISDVTNYIERYKKHIDGSCPVHEREFNRNYQYSTLSYFHSILGLSV